MDAMFASQLGDRRAGIVLTYDRNDLSLGETAYS